MVNRRGFFATLLGPLVGRQLPAKPNPRYRSTFIDCRIAEPEFKFMWTGFKVADNALKYSSGYIEQEGARCP